MPICGAINMPDPTTNLPRFFCSQLPAQPGARCQLDGDETRHARKVLRLQVGDQVHLFDGQGSQAVAVIETFTRDQTDCRCEQISKVEAPPLQLTIASAVPKGTRAQEMVDQLSQLGVSRWWPVRSERSVVDPRQNKLERFSRQTIESAKQCGRLHVMQVEQVRDLAQVLAEAGPAAVKLIALPGGAALPTLAQRLAGVGDVVVLIGPEGGFTDNEVAAARAAGFEPWTFSPHVLRIETAAAAAASVLRYLVM